jgi:AI-2E family transporter
VGDTCLSAQLYSDPWTDDRRRGLPARGPFVYSLWVAFLPAGLYLLIHLVEGETVTPILLARRCTINPVLVILSLVFWYWMWGAPGAVLSTPMLAITKIICDRIRPLMAFGHFMYGSQRAVLAPTDGCRRHPRAPR